MFTFRATLGALLALVFSMSFHPRAMATDVGFRESLRAETHRPPTPRFERSSFLVSAAVSHVTLSSDGLHMAWLRGPDGGRALWLSDTQRGASRQILTTTDATALLWSRDSRWLLVASPDRMFAVAAAGQSGSRVLTPLGGMAERTSMGVDPTRPAAVVIRERMRDAHGVPSGWRLLRVAVGGHDEVLAESADRITGFAFAGDGALAWLQVMHDASIVTSQVMKDGVRVPVLRCEAMHRCTLWPVVDGERRPLFLGDLGGSLRSVQRRDADGRITTLASDPRHEADLDELGADPSTGLPMIASYRAGVVASDGLDAASDTHVRRIQAHFPGMALSFQPGTAQWLVVERSGAQQGARYHLYTPATGAFTTAIDAPPLRAREGGPASWLPTSAMATQIPFDWITSDGMRLHGFVRVPPGKDPASLPVVALIHGGPWGNVAANEFGTGVAQFLVNRGYAVFEPNFRGSTGHGRDYMLAANGDFGNGRVQRDIVEGVQALLAQGVGDSQRVGIVGASFGGYSALLGITWQPALFKVGVALVPPSDFAWDLTWITRTTEATALSPALPFERWMQMVDMDLHDRTQMARLHDASPLANAARMERPLTIIAGGEDQRVALRGVLGYVARLRSIGKPVTLLVDPVAGHTDARPVASEAALYLIADTLQRQLGGVPEEEPDAVLRDYLTVNLRVPMR